MSEKPGHIREIIEGLQQQRDEIAVRMHLAKAEVRDDWEKLEKRWQELHRKYEPIKHTLEDTSENVLAGLKLTAHELTDGFKRVGKQVLGRDH